MNNILIEVKWQKRRHVTSTESIFEDVYNSNITKLQLSKNAPHRQAVANVQSQEVFRSIVLIDFLDQIAVSRNGMPYSVL